MSKVNRHANLFVMPVLFYECPDMNNGARCAEVMNGRDRGSAMHEAVGLRSELCVLFMHNSVLLVLPPVKKFKQLLTTAQLCDIEIPDML